VLLSRAMKGKPTWVLKGTERSTRRLLWQVSLLDGESLDELARQFGLDSRKKGARPLQAAELERLAPFVPDGFCADVERDDFELTNRFLWTQPWSADANHCVELRPTWQSILDIAQGYAPMQLFERAQADRTRVPWLAHQRFHAAGHASSDPPVAAVLRDGSTWVAIATHGDDEVRACLTPPLLEVLAALDEPRAEELAFALHEAPGAGWTPRRLARGNVIRALGALPTDRALEALLQRPGDSGGSRHPAAGAQTLEQAIALGQEYERMHGPRREWPRLRELAGLSADERKAILDRPLGGEQLSDFVRAVGALGKLQHAPAEPFLIEVMERSPSYLARQAAISALAASDSPTARAAAIQRFDEALDGLVGRIAIATALRWPEGLEELARWLGTDVDSSIRALNLDNLGEALVWMLADGGARPHAGATAVVSALIPEPETRAWFEEKFAALDALAAPPGG
jgi:hypothetical protein